MKKSETRSLAYKSLIERYKSIGNTSQNQLKLKLLFKIIITLFSIIGLTFVIIISTTLFYIFNLSNDSVELDLRSLKLELTSFIFTQDLDGNFYEYQPVYAGESRVWVDYDNIPTAMKDAMVAIEDKRFYEHHGVDWVRTGGAIMNFVSGRDNYGGSTITQQLIKNITNKTEVSIARKVSEIFAALGFERKYSKDEILECYLNVVNFGSGCNGVQAAANLYFDKDISQCSIAECASIAGITQNPTKYTPLDYPEQNKERQQIVIQAMYDQHMINLQDYNQAMYDSEHMIFTDGTKSNTVNNIPINNWYIEAMLDDITKDLSDSMSIDKNTASYMVMHNGFKIYSAIDIEAQRIAENVMQDDSIMPSNPNIQVGYIMMDYNGRVLASVGQRGIKEANLLWDCANHATRQPGSSFKPLGAYAPALEYKLYNYSSILPDRPLDNIPGTSGLWPPNWYGYYKGQMTLQYAIEISANAPAAQVVKKLTPEKSFEFVTEKFGFTTLNQAEDSTYSGMATGGSYNGVTVREMTAAFQTFGNGGIYNKPYMYFYVEDNKGNIVLDNRNKLGTQAISSENATIMRKLLQNVVYGSEGTGSLGQVPGFTTFAKTGTTDYNENSWYVGGTPYAVSGIWIGYETPTQMSNSESNYAAKIWKNIMSKVLSDKPYKAFSDSENILVRNYCKDTGLLASSGCTNVATGYYTSDNLPAKCMHVKTITDTNQSNNSSSSDSSSSTSNSSSLDQSSLSSDSSLASTSNDTQSTSSSESSTSTESSYVSSDKSENDSTKESQHNTSSTSDADVSINFLTPESSGTSTQ